MTSKGLDDKVGVMLKSELKPLKKLADDLSNQQDVNENISSLTEAFKLFSQETERLEKAYNTLQCQLKSVNLELEETNKQLQNKVSELDDVTNYLQNILNNISQGMLFVNNDGLITTYNGAAERFLKKPSGLVLFRSYWDSFADDIFGFSMRQMLQERRQQEHSVITISYHDTEDRILEIDTTFIDRGTLTHRGVIILLRDVTKLRQLQRLANRNNRMKELGEMASSVAHEIRNPLAGIEGYASLLNRDLEDQPHLKEMSQAIIKGSQTINKLVTNVLHYARPLKLNLQRTNMNDLIEETVNLAKVGIKIPTDITINTQLMSKSLYVYLDREIISSALFNLISNAVQAITEKGSLTITLNEIDNSAVIEIIDTGKGIDKKNLEKIFSPFFTTKVDGTGIGLAEVHKALLAHGGSVEVSSELDRGATFTLKLPLKY